MSSHRSWFRKRLLPWRAGFLVDTAEEARLVSLLETDPECREDGELFLDRDGVAWPADGHIPPSIVAHWAVARAELRGLERILVARHLRDCADCRDELTMVGYDPILEAVPTTMSPARPDLSAVPAAAGPARRGCARWALAGWAVGATAAAVLALVLTRDTRVRPDRPASLAPAFRLAVTRGDAPLLIAVHPSTRLIVLGPPALPADAGAAARFTIEDPRGHVILDGVPPVAEDEDAPATTIVLAATDGGFAAGEYRFTWIYTTAAAGEESRVTIPFRIAIEER